MIPHIVRGNGFHSDLDRTCDDISLRIGTLPDDKPRNAGFKA
jgi:hypothetical protein